MIKAIQALENSLGYAKFQDPKIKRAALKLLTELDNELTTEDYDPSPPVENAGDTLQTLLDDADTEQENASTETSDEGEFEGLGEDEDDEDENEKK